MSRRRIIIAPRVPIFLGCEGESEQAYGQRLNDLVHEEGHAFHLEVVTLNPGAGDPLSRVQRAKQEIARRQLRRAYFARKVILMDSDQVDNDHPRRHRAEQMARDCGITIIWQTPCHEAVLLRHIEGCTERRPASSNDAAAALRRAWPQYRKPMTKQQLAEHITLDAVRRAAAVEPLLAAFLHEIALLP